MTTVHLFPAEEQTGYKQTQPYYRAIGFDGGYCIGFAMTLEEQQACFSEVSDVQFQIHSSQEEATVAVLIDELKKHQEHITHHQAEDLYEIWLTK